jgi:hypothetical protein
VILLLILVIAFILIMMVCYGLGAVIGVIWAAYTEHKKDKLKK